MSETNQPADDSPSNYSGTYIKAIEILGSREVEVLKEVAKARTNREIAERLSISHRTVEKHREHINNKIGLSGQRSLFLWCKKHIKNS